MQIDFDLCYFFSPDASPAEKAEAKAVINRVSKNLGDIYKRANMNAPRSFARNVGGTLVRFELPRMFTARSVSGSYTANAQTLKALMEALIELNMIELRANFAPALYKMGLPYGRTQIWDTVSAFRKRGYGDCKTVSAILCAQRRLAGRPGDPWHRFMPRPDGGLDYHILVDVSQSGAPNFEDPSKVLGMGANENASFVS